jgi:glycosyltransferase involved in cell wall biosynthesis
VPEQRLAESHRLPGPTGPISVSVLGSLPPTKGVSPYTSHLVDALAQRGDVKLDVLAFDSIYPRRRYPGGEPDEAGMAYSPPDDVHVRRFVNWYNPGSWIRAGCSFKGDVVHAQWWSYALAPVYMTALGLARMRGKRVVLTVHNVAPHEEGWAKRALNSAVLRFAHRFIVHSERNRRDLIERIGGDASRVHVLPHGVLDTPRSGISHAQARERLGLPREAKVILCFGHLRPYKGVDVLLCAFADIVREEPDALLVIAGRPWTDWQPYAALIEELGIGQHVHLFLDYVPTSEVEQYFVAADVVALPYTRFDAQTGVGTRALPFGRPLVVTATGGLPELALDPEAIVPPADAPALARALLRVLGDERVRDRMAVDSLTLAASLGWDSIARRTVEVYEAALSDEPAPETVEDRAGGEVAEVRRA